MLLGKRIVAQGLFNGATHHLVQVAPDLTLIDANYFTQWLRGIFFHGGLLKVCTDAS